MREHERMIRNVPAHQSAGAKRRRRSLPLAFSAMLSILFLGAGFLAIPSIAAATQERGKIGKTIFTYQRQPDGVYALDWSPDGKRLLSTSWDGQT